jgi:lipoprotein-anchoring transpeptidase ErfK/SrfK
MARNQAGGIFVIAARGAICREAIMGPVHRCRFAASAIVATVLWSAPGWAEPLALTDPVGFPGTIFQQVLPEPATPQQPQADVNDDAAAVPDHLRRRLVAYPTSEPPGTIVIDTPNTYLYYVLGGGRAIRYGVGVGREGFTWAGVQAINRKQEWPDWHPPAEMIERQPYLPRFMAGGPGNPLGARAMYLAGTLYRIHGTSDPSSIGKHVSSGCIRMLNEDAIDLYNRTPLGTKVVVLPEHGRRAAASRPAPRPAARPAPARERAPQAMHSALRSPQSVAHAENPSRSQLMFGSYASRLY